MRHQHLIACMIQIVRVGMSRARMVVCGWRRTEAAGRGRGCAAAAYDVVVDESVRSTGSLTVDRLCGLCGWCWCWCRWCWSLECVLVSA